VNLVPAIEQAEKAFQAFLALATRIKPSQKALDGIERLDTKLSFFANRTAPA